MIAELVELTKVCTTCEIEKGVDEYYKKKTGKYGVRGECKCCYAERRKAYYLANREAALEYRKAYREANREAVLEQKKAYYEANKEAVLGRQSAYGKANRHLYNAQAAKRKAAKLQATPAWADLEAIKGMYELAAIFNRTGMNLHVDHVVPLISDLVCGLHCEANLQLMPASDNTSKGNRHWPDMPE